MLEQGPWIRTDLVFARDCPTVCDSTSTFILDITLYQVMSDLRSLLCGRPGGPAAM